MLQNGLWGRPSLLTPCLSMQKWGHVFEVSSPFQRRQGTSLLEHCREHPHPPGRDEAASAVLARGRSYKLIKQDFRHLSTPPEAALVVRGRLWIPALGCFGRAPSPRPHCWDCGFPIPNPPRDSQDKMPRHRRASALSCVLGFPVFLLGSAFRPDL